MYNIISTAECNLGDTSIESSDCTPMNGFMTAWVAKSDERRLSETEIYNVIETYSNSYANDEKGVLSVSYIGIREPAIDKATAPSSTLGPGAAAGISIAGIVLLSILALIAKKRRDRNKSVEEVERSSSSVVNDALFMIDDEEEMKEVPDDASKSSACTEDHTTFDGSLMQSATFESEDQSHSEGFEVKL